MKNIIYLITLINIFSLNCLLAQDEICYTVSNSSTLADKLFYFENNLWFEVAGTNATDVEALTIDQNTGTMYAINGNQFGIIDKFTAQFILINTLGIANGSIGTFTFNNVKSLAWCNEEEVIYATYRRPYYGHNDLLFKINPITGVIISDAFGIGNDYVLIEEVLNGTGVGAQDIYNVSGIAFHPISKQLFVLHTDENFRNSFSIINRTNGQLTQIVYDLGENSTRPFEGLGFNDAGNLFATTSENAYTQFKNRNYFINGAIATSWVILYGLNMGFNSIACYKPLQCADTLKIINANIPSNMYAAKEVIKAKGNATVADLIIMQAEQTVELKADFYCSSNTDLLLIIDNCE